MISYISRYSLFVCCFYLLLFALLDNLVQHFGRSRLFLNVLINKLTWLGYQTAVTVNKNSLQNSCVLSVHLILFHISCETSLQAKRGGTLCCPRHVYSSKEKRERTIRRMFIDHAMWHTCAGTVHSVYRWKFPLCSPFLQSFLQGQPGTVISHVKATRNKVQVLTRDMGRREICWSGENMQTPHSKAWEIDHLSTLLGILEQAL